MESFGKRSAAYICYLLVNISWYATCLIGIIISAALIYSLFGDPKTFGITLPIAESLVSFNESEAYNYLTIESVNAKVNYTYIFQQSPTIYYLNFIFIFLTLVLVLYGIYQLRLLLKTTVNEAVFTVDNIRRIKTIAILVIAWAPINWVYQYFILSRIGDFIETNGFQIDLPFFYDSFLFGLLIYALATVFQKGLEMYQELKLTV